MENVTNRLIQLRQEHGLTQMEMAKRIGTNKSTISRYESGEIKPNLDAMLKIREAFGVSLDWIAGLDTDDNVSYGVVISDCINSEITAEDLSDAIAFIKKQRKGKNEK
jgi:Predicted transcriptional regulators